MDSVPRLIAALLLVCFAGETLAVGNVNATGTTPVATYTASGTGHDGATVLHGTGGSAAAACASLAAALSTDGNYTQGSYDYTASFTVTASTETTCTMSNTHSQHYNGNQAVCSPNCTTTATSTGYSYGVSKVVNNVPSCGAGTTSVAGNCVCNAGTKPKDANTCAPYICTPQALGVTNMIHDPTYPQDGKSNFVCDTAYPTASGKGPWSNPSFGCSVMESPLSYGTLGQVITVQVGVTVTANQCEGGSGNGSSPSTAPSATINDTLPPPATACAAGTCPGTQNGLSVCVACSSTSTTTSVTPTASASSAPPNNTTPGQTVTQANCFTDGPGSQSGFCQVSTTTYATDGSTIVAQNTGSQSIGQYCAANAGDAQCKAAGLGPATAASGASGSASGAGGDGGGAGFGGSCASGFTCTGDSDAVTCAIATEQHQRDCQFVKNFGDGTTTNSASDLATAAFAAGDLPSSHPRNAANVTTSVFGFDTTDLLGGACPSDVTLSLASIRTFSIPLSRACTALQTLGAILQTITLLSCIGIVFIRGK